MKYKLVVISDSHGNDKSVLDVMERHKDASYFLHLGDLCTDLADYYDLVMVRGNNDYNYDFPSARVFECNGLRIYMTHSDRYFGPSRYTALADKARKEKCQIALFGHTHMKFDEVVNGVRLINPGSLYYNRDFSDVGYIIIEVDEDGSYKISSQLL